MRRAQEIYEAFAYQYNNFERALNDSLGIGADATAAGSSEPQTGEDDELLLWGL